MGNDHERTKGCQVILKTQLAFVGIAT